jgi:hypothetical protein
MNAAPSDSLHAVPGPLARQLLLELRNNLDSLEPLFQRGREGGPVRHDAASTLQQPLFDVATQLRVSTLELVLADLMAADDGDDELWIPRRAGGQGTAAWNDGVRLRQLYVQTISARAMAAAQRDGRHVDGDIAERLRGLRRGFQQTYGLLSAEIGEPGWRDVAARVLSHFVPRRQLAVPVAPATTPLHQDPIRSAA